MTTQADTPSQLPDPCLQWMVKQQLQDIDDGANADNRIAQLRHNGYQMVADEIERISKLGWCVKDWAGNRLFPDRTFPSFEEGWEFIRSQFENEEDWQDLYVLRTVDE